MIITFVNGLQWRLTVRDGIVKFQIPTHVPTCVENEWKENNDKMKNQVVLNIPLERALRVLKMLNGSYSIE